MLLDQTNSSTVDVRYGWHGMGRYLEVYLLNGNSPPDSNINMWLLVDVEEAKILIKESDIPSVKLCQWLAESPRSHLLSVWCINPSKQDQEYDSYIVIETTGSHWQSASLPKSVLYELFGRDQWLSWSADGTQVAVDDLGLLYRKQGQEAWTRYDNGDFTAANILVSPTGQYIGYFAFCENGDQCFKVVDTVTNEPFAIVNQTELELRYIVGWSPKATSLLGVHKENGLVAITYPFTEVSFEFPFQVVQQAIWISEDFR